MKKIIVIMLSLLFLASCNNVGIENNESQATEAELKVHEYGEFEINELEKNLAKVKNIELESWELEFINLELVEIFNRQIEKKALNDNDLSICEQLEDNVDDCKYNVTVMSKDINNCDKLLEESYILNCKNDITVNIATEDLDESICNDIIDESGEKHIFNSCITRVIMSKASQNWDSNLCNKINNLADQSVCIEAVEMENDLID